MAGELKNSVSSTAKNRIAKNDEKISNLETRHVENQMMMGYGLPSKEPSLAPLSQHSSNVKPSSQECTHAVQHAVQKSSNESLENFGSGDGMRTQRSVTSSTKLPTTTKSSRRARIKVWRKSRRCFRRKSWWPESRADFQTHWELGRKGASSRRRS